MKHFPLIFATLLFWSCKQHLFQTEALFAIEQNGKTGFINNKGKIVIQPVFRSAGNFSEGLAPARLNGTYGYINVTGKWTIAPQFDYAAPFSEGFAIVYKDAVPFYINQKGEKPFKNNFQFLGDFKNGRALVKTTTGKTGMLDKAGRLFIDTVFSEIGSFTEGLAIVEDLKDTVSQMLNEKVGIIDSTGKFLVPYGKYRGIQNLENGYFKVEIPPSKNDTIDGHSTQTGFIDKTGKLIMFRNHQNNSWIIGYPHCGLIRTILYKYWIPEEDGTTYTSTKAYEGYADIKGNIVINDTTFRNATDFSCNRAFAEIEEDEWSRNYRMINTKGKFVSPLKFNRIDDKGFINGLAIVQSNTTWKWGVIDTNARFVIKPQFEEITRVENYFVFGVRGLNDTQDYPLLYGIAKTNGQIIMKPIMQEFKRSGFKDSVLPCVINGKLAYVHEQGKVIWKDAFVNQNPETENLNIDYMNRGYFYATSTSDKTDIGGFGRSGNTAYNVISAKQKFLSKSLTIIVSKDSASAFQDQYDGMKVYVANNNSYSVQFNASDSRLYMKVQALNPKGKWEDIEYLPSSWCGNSYHILTLEPNQYWSFTTPKYEGDFKTKLRIALQYIDPNSKEEKRRERKEITVYSNEYKGSINPSQFWRKQDYYPASIMDPYTE